MELVIPRMGGALGLQLPPQKKGGARRSAANAATHSPPRPTRSIPLSAPGRRYGGGLCLGPPGLQRGDKPGAAGPGGPSVTAQLCSGIHPPQLPSPIALVGTSVGPGGGGW